MWSAPRSNERIGYPPTWSPLPPSSGVLLAMLSTFMGFSGVLLEMSLTLARSAGGLLASGSTLPAFANALLASPSTYGVSSGLESPVWHFHDDLEAGSFQFPFSRRSRDVESSV